MLGLGHEFFRTQNSAVLRTVEFFLMSKLHSSSHKQPELFTSMPLAPPKMAQDRLSVHQCFLLKPNVSPMTAVAILFRGSNYLCPHRVQMDVADKLSQVS